MWTRFVVCVHRKHKNFIDNGTHVTRKYPSHINYSSKMSDFLRFYLYFCHVIDDFLLVLKRSTKVSKNLTWQNHGQLFFAQELIKKVKLKCCGI